jgi:hypothetical protein
MHKRVATLFTLALLSCTIPAHVALASTDTTDASPFHAIQAFIASIVDGAEAIIAEVVATVNSGIASFESSGDSVSYSAAAAALQASPAASPAQPPPVNSFGSPPSTATTTPVTQVVVEKEQPIIEEMPSSGSTISPSDLHGILSGLSDVLSLIPGAVSSGNSSANVESQIAALQSAISNQSYDAAASPPLCGGSPNTIAAASNIGQLAGTTITNPSITGGSITAASVSGGPVAATSLSASGDTSLSGDLNVGGNFTAGSISFGAASSSNTITTDATSTNLFSALGTFTTGVFNTLTTAIANITGLTATNATTTNLVATNATSTNRRDDSRR